jgi:hypothetical protein
MNPFRKLQAISILCLASVLVPSLATAHAAAVSDRTGGVRSPPEQIMRSEARGREVTVTQEGMNRTPPSPRPSPSQ